MPRARLIDSDLVRVIRENVSYNPDTGILTRIKGVRKSRAGSVLGVMTAAGYLSVGISGRRMFVHRVAWVLVTGENPSDIDHINGCRADNRWVNLRQVSFSQNNANSATREDNKCGVKGVCWDKSRGKWMANIKVDKTHVSLGRFYHFDEAVAIRKEAEKHYHGVFARDPDLTPSAWTPHTLIKNTTSANTSGVTGVVWDEAKKKWAARIGIKGRTVNLGRFDEFEDAVAAREKAEKDYSAEYKSPFRDQILTLTQN